MADLLSHTLVAFSVLTVLSWRIDWLTSPWIAVGVCGAAIPDLMKIRIFVDPETIESLLGLPFTWVAIATLGGVLLLAGAITMLFSRENWWRAYTTLVAGGVLSLLGDWLRAFPDGHADPWLYPFLPTYRPPTPGLYVTSDPRVLLIVLLVALGVAVTDWRRA